MVWRSSMVAVAVALIAQAQAFEVTLVNSCSESIDVFDSKTTETLQSGGTSTRTVSPGAAYVYRKGTGGQATLAEFSADNNAAWYDISIIPTGDKSGPGLCGSLEECKAVTGGVGFNVAMSIEPSQTDGSRCVSLTCMEDGCSDAYQYPKDDTKTHACPSSVDFTVTFCPGGSSGDTSTIEQVANEAQSSVQQFATTTAPTEAPTQAPTEAPTQAPTQAPTEAPTQAPTEAPTMPPTEAPTQPPTEAPTQPPTEAPTMPPTEVPTMPPTEAPTTSSASASAPSDVDAGDSQWKDFVGKVGAHNETSSSSSSGVAVGDDESGSESSSSQSTTQTSATEQPVSYEKAGKTTALQTSGNDGSVEQVNTQSSGGSSGGAAYIVLSIGAAVGMIAVAAIVVIRKKKQAFDEMDSKTPVLNTMRDGPTDHSVLMTATNSTSAVL
ncbi:Thaumatin-like protein [Phytophthora ramorum]|uniref:Thaumatin-like protein n=1 Tax=Phytophthora ramorum TaxID=164328 RepID=UPI0030978EBA|nr:Thaumatin-like protein [Phytophthora ramorum]